MSEAVEKVQAQMPEMLPRGEQDVERATLAYFLLHGLAHITRGQSQATISPNYTWESKREGYSRDDQNIAAPCCRAAVAQ